MKYTDRNLPLKLLLTNSTCYKGTGKMKPCGVLIHDTGAVNPNLKRYIQPTDDDPEREKWLEMLGRNQYNNDYNHQYRKMGVNAWIGMLADGTVTTIQTLPWDYRPWGCGSGKNGSCNGGWIQFEICMGRKTDSVYFEAAYREACEITAFLCQQFGFDPYGTVDYKGMKVPAILCHADSHKLGLGSNHSDIYSYFGLFGKNMDTFRADVAALIGKVEVTVPSKDAEKPSFPYLVRITDTHLNYRKGPGRNYASRGYIKPGTYTIVDEQDGWGLLKAFSDDRNGWVMLKYTTKK